jgi:hypothetical protein
MLRKDFCKFMLNVFGTEQVFLHNRITFVKLNQEIELKYYLAIILSLSLTIAKSQNHVRNSIIINASIDTLTNIISGTEKIIYKNSSLDTLNEIFLHAWPASFRNRNTELGYRSRENRKLDIYFALPEEKGNIYDFLFVNNADTLVWSYLNHSHDIIELELSKSLKPNETITIVTPFKLKLPNARFTGFGYSDKGFYLKEWYLSPVVYRDKKWHKMSNKNLDDLFIEPSMYLIKLRFPENYKITSNLLYSESYMGFGRFGATLSGKTLGSANIMIYKDHKFKKYEIVTKSSNIVTVETDIKYPFMFSIDDPFEDLLKRQLDFLESNLGEYKTSKLWVSSVYLKNNPIYSLNTIPLIKTMGPKFQKEIEIFKALSYNYINSSIFTNPRDDAWMIEGLNAYLLSLYIKRYYPNKKLFGNLSDYWVSRFFDLSELKFNDRQELLYLIMARQNLDQALGISKDEFANLNLLAMNQFKTSMGLSYLRDYLGEEEFIKSLKETFSHSSKKFIDTKQVEKIFNKNTNGKSNWFFEDFIAKRNLIDFKLKLKDDEVIITNKTKYTGPLKIYGYKKDSLVFAQWREGFTDTMKFIPPALDFDRIVLNDNNTLPEYNLRDNTLKYNRKWYDVIDKPLQLKLMTDIENPHYTQVFVNPYIEWNAYDGLVLGGAFYNKSIIRRPFNYNISPTYAFNAKSLTGSGSMSYTYYFRESDILHSIKFGMFAKFSHYDTDLAYFKYNPAVSLHFKRPNPRGVESNTLFMRYVSVEKENPNLSQPIDDLGKYEEYKIFNLRHTYRNPEIVDDYRIKTDLQLGDKFGKISSEIRYRKETDWRNRIDIRFFAGIFLYNNVDNTYYDFGINSSTDYLFDYNFLGRSETSGILSQQIIVNDGAFKTKYNTFANNWLVSTNAHVSIWKFFEIYGDVGMYSNKGESNQFIWDTGVRFNFVPEIFEFYFPIYSNKGSEFGHNYEERIRFVFTADFGEIVNYFRRGLF